MYKRSIDAKLNVERFNMAYICEHCGKLVEDEDKFGSGRFCSRSCANSRKHSSETKNKIKRSVNKFIKCDCQYCGKEFTKLISKRTHEVYCQHNPNKIKNLSGSKVHEKNLDKKYVTRYGDILDATNEEIQKYLYEHTHCEICGKTIDDINQSNPRYHMKRLCIDHDHTTKTFRGVLCPVCNRQLGWFEKYSANIKDYLDKNSK